MTRTSGHQSSGTYEALLSRSAFLNRFSAKNLGPICRPFKLCGGLQLRLSVAWLAILPRRSPHTIYSNRHTTPAREDPSGARDKFVGCGSLGIAFVGVRISAIVGSSFTGESHGPKPVVSCGVGPGWSR